jgi:hypothetical protein
VSHRTGASKSSFDKLGFCRTELGRRGRPFSFVNFAADEARLGGVADEVMYQIPSSLPYALLLSRSQSLFSLNVTNAA